MNDRLTRLFERHRGRYVAGAIVLLMLEVLLIVAPMVALFPAHYEGLSVAEYLLVVATADGAAIAVYALALGVHSRDIRALISWCDRPNERDRAAAQRFAFDGPRRSVAVVCVVAMPLGAGLIWLIATRHHHTSVTDLLELAVGAVSSIVLAGVNAWFTLEVLLRPVRVALGPPPPDMRRANLPLRLALVVPSTICLAAFSLGYLTTTRSRAGSGHLITVYEVAVACTALCLLMVVPLFIAGVVTPLRDLARATREVAAGQFSTRVPVAGTDQLGDLARSFNQMLEELAASRVRIVTAADSARRKVERDLHDGAQQRLVLLSLKAGMLERQVGPTPLLAEIRADIEVALAELRDLAHGIYPAVLESDGLVAAVGAVSNDCPLPTTLDSDGTGRYPREIEAAVYFCCLEALQNAAKHAGEGAHAEIRLHHSDGSLHFEVADDGAGFDPAAARDSGGLQNMRDRIGALGGTLSIAAAPGAGTRIAGSLPVERG
jgi:signal transduction histidine kinase